jgi:Zn-dependent M16 (insulinase) family peptidase
VQDVSVLPTLTRDDIVADKAYPVLQHFGSCQTTVQPTGGMSYVTTAFGNWGVQPLPDELLPYAPLFSTAMSALGTDAMTHRELSQAVDLHCGSPLAHRLFNRRARRVAVSPLASASRLMCRRCHATCRAPSS